MTTLATRPDAAEDDPPERTRRRRIPAVLDRWYAVVGVAAAPLAMLLVSLLAGGGPRTEGADDALLTLAMRDASHGHVLVGAYSRYGWHHPGPAFLYVAGLPTRLWGGSPTGTWIGAVAVALACAVAVVAALRWACGRWPAWWGAIAVLLTVAGLGAGIFRDPWNPYSVILPVLVAGVLAALAAAGVRGAFVWSLVAGSFAIQTHISCTPVVGAWLAIAAVLVALRWRRDRRRHGGRDDGPGDIPAGLPAFDHSEPAWWRYRPDVALAVMALVLEWLPPLWDEAFGSHNLTKIWDFFTAPHPTHSWDFAWHEVTAFLGIVLFQHHAGVRDGVADPHVWVTDASFVALCLFAVVVGRRRGRPVAVALGSLALAATVTGAYSITREVGIPYRYLTLWLTVMPAMAIVGAAAAVEGLVVKRPVLIAAGACVTGALALAVESVLQAPPAVSLSDRDVASAWTMLSPVVGGGHAAVHLEIVDDDRWPTTAGIALQLERHGHPARVDPPWPLLFGNNRRASGTEPDVVVLADPGHVVPNATMLGRAGATAVWLAQEGALCWWGWIPFGGPACPVGAATGVQ